MFTLNCRGSLLVVDKPIVMGILNLTPDSFYSGSRVDNKSLLQKAEQMLAEGAAILDVGGESTRPGSQQIAEKDELIRVIDSIELLHTTFPEAIISIDTYHSNVAKEAVNAGASIVNDVSGGTLDRDMITTVGNLQVPYVCMHMKGTPETMQKEAVYNDITKEVLDYFIEKTEECKIAGIKDMIIDPGYGFAKTISHNFELLKKQQTLKMLDKPIMVGLSRKGTIYKTLNTTAEKALNGTTVLHTIALLNGANILRVHDVREAIEAIELVKAYQTG